MNPDDVVLAEVLDQAGVLTSAVFDTPHPFRPGFNYQRGSRVLEQIPGQESDPWRSHPRRVQFPCDPSRLRNPHTTLTQYLRNVHDRRDEQDHFCARTATATARWLEANRRNSPFFLYIDTLDPHKPWDPPQHCINRYAPNYPAERVIYPRYDRVGFLSAEKPEFCRALYPARATLVDRGVASPLDAIRALGLWQDTAVLFTTDHGSYPGEHGYIGKSLVSESFQQCLPMYSEVSHIPLLAHLPGIAPHANRTLVQPVDLPATVCELPGVAAHAQFEGSSFLPYVRENGLPPRKIAISSPRVSGDDPAIPHPSSRSPITDGEWLLIYGSQAGAGLFEPAGVSIYGDSRHGAAAAALWSLPLALAKPAFKRMDAIAYGPVRRAASSALLLPCVFLTGGFEIGAPSIVFFAALGGAIDMFLGIVLLMYATKRVAAHKGAPLWNTAPLWGVIAATIWLRELPGWPIHAAAALVVMGSCVLAKPGRTEVRERAGVRGLSAALGAGLWWGLAGTAIAKCCLTQGMSRATAHFVYMVAAALCWALAGLLRGRSHREMVPWRGVRTALTTALKGMVGGMLLWFIALDRAPANVLAPIRGVMTAFLVILSMLLLCERPTPRASVGLVGVASAAIFG